MIVAMETMYSAVGKISFSDKLFLCLTTVIPVEISLPNRVSPNINSRRAPAKTPKSKAIGQQYSVKVTVSKQVEIKIAVIILRL